MTEHEAGQPVDGARPVVPPPAAAPPAAPPPTVTPPPVSPALGQEVAGERAAPSYQPPPALPTEPPGREPGDALGAGSRWLPGAAPAPAPAPPANPPLAMPPVEVVPAAGVPPRPSPLPAPRPARPQPGPGAAPPRADARGLRPEQTSRPVTRSRKARLVVKRVDPWSVFLYSLVASIFLGIALVIAVGVLYGLLSKLGVLDSLNTLISDVTAEPGTTAAPSSFVSGGKVLTFAAMIAALDVVLITALSTLGAFLYNLCAALTGGVEVTLSDQG